MQKAKEKRFFHIKVLTPNKVHISFTGIKVIYDKRHRLIDE